MPLLPSNWDLPEGIKRRVGEKIGRQRAMAADGHLLLLLHEVPGPNDEESVGAVFWRRPDQEWMSTQRGRGLHVLTKHIEAYQTRVDALEDAVTEARSATDFFRILESVVPIDRAAQNLLRALQSARESLQDAREIIVLRDAAQEVASTVELLHADLKNAIEFAMARRAEEQAEAAHQITKAGHRLNVLMAIFLPLTALGSMFGMNLVHGLEGSSVWLFWAVLGGGMLLGLSVRAWVGR